MATSKKNFDFAILGGGLSGCLVAKALNRQGHSNIALIEASGQIGNHHSGATSDEILFLPSGNATDKALDFLASLTGQDFSRNDHESRPLTFEKGQFQPFIGFGEKVPAEVDELMSYLNPQVVTTSPDITDLLHDLQSDIPAHVFTKSQITKLEVEQGQVHAAVINGDHRIEAKTFILCLPPTELLKILPVAAIDAKISQKLNRAKLWTSISLSLVHKKSLTRETAVHIFTGGESSACIGHFQSTAIGQNISQWMSFVHSEDFDEEQTASVLREMKRLIKRAYPTIFEDLSLERLVVRPNSHGHIALKLENDFSLPGIDNLWLSSGLLRAEKNLVGTILQVQRVTNSIHRADGMTSSAPELSI